MGVKSGSSLFTAAYFLRVTVYFKAFWIALNILGAQLKKSKWHLKKLSYTKSQDNFTQYTHVPP